MALKLSASSWALWPIKDSGKFFLSRDRVYAFSPWIWMDSVWLFWAREFAVSDVVPVSCPGLTILAASFPVFWNICPCNPELHVRSLTTLLERPPEEYSRMHQKKVGDRLRCQVCEWSYLGFSSPVQVPAEYHWGTPVNTV